MWLFKVDSMDQDYTLIAGDRRKLTEPYGSVSLVSIAPLCGISLELGTEVDFRVTLAYELEGLTGGVVGAELGLDTGTCVRIGTIEVTEGAGQVDVVGTICVDWLHDWLSKDPAYDWKVYLGIQIGYWEDPYDFFRPLHWESLSDCFYIIVEAQ